MILVVSVVAHVEFKQVIGLIQIGLVELLVGAPLARNLEVFVEGVDIGHMTLNTHLAPEFDKHIGRLQRRLHVVVRRIDFAQGKFRRVDDFARDADDGELFVALGQCADVV